MRTKSYNKTSMIYRNKLLKAGYTCQFNWVSQWEYENVTVKGPLFRGYGGEFPTPRKAYEYVTRWRN